MSLIKFYDFEYDGLKLSDLGYSVCQFDTKGIQTVSNGSQITFNKVSTLNGAKHELTSVKYESCLESTFQICKNICGSDVLEISVDELRLISKWLNRTEFHKFKILNDAYLDIYFEASFNISRIEMDGKLYGLELKLQTNRPFALQEPKKITIKNLIQNGKHIVKDYSDVEGYIYPEVEITINESGNLNIYNEIEDRNTFIANCVAGEIIKMNYPIIETSSSTHKIQNDFNWNFFRIANTFTDSVNKVTISLPCTMKIIYSPTVKLGV
jgi:hypothetical protein